MIYPTAPGGREWALPPTADVADAAWSPELWGGMSITRAGEAGVFHTDGAGPDAMVRLNVGSPWGTAWWRDVELTMYVRKTSSIGCRANDPWDEHWEMFARGERHDDVDLSFAEINNGAAAPPGTATWPWYRNFGSGKVKASCLGTAYHGNLYAANGEALFEKEVSHYAGYAEQRGSVLPAMWPNATGRWIGYKLVVRGSASDPHWVHLELWGDLDATDAWKQLSAYDDLPGRWPAANSALDGCTAPPYGYSRDQLITWAGPYVTFRSDCMGMDFKWLSAREVGPID
jgi:hypothetical protein